MKFLGLLCFVGCFAINLSACGNKGVLYLPDQPTSKQATQAPDQASKKQQTEKKQ